MASIKRAHVFACEIGADTKADLVQELRFLANRLDREGITAGVTGAYSSGAIYAYRHNPNMTHDEYFRQIGEKIKADRTPGAST